MSEEKAAQKMLRGGGRGREKEEKGKREGRGGRSEEEEKEYRKPLTVPHFQLLCLKPVQHRGQSLTILSRWL